MKSDDLDWLYRDDDEHTRVLGQSGTPQRGGYPEAGQGYPDPREGYPDPARDRHRAGQFPADDVYRQEAPPPRGTGPVGPPPAAPPSRRRRRRRRHPIRNLFLTLLVAWLVFLVGTPIFAWSTIDVVEGYDSDLPDQPGTAVLLVGSDGRDNLTPEEQRRLGTGSTDGRRTDTMMLLYTPPSGKSVLLGLPRDSFVEIPGRGNNKLNAAFAYGGAPLLIQTIEHNTGIRVDGYLEVGMAGLANMVDAVGGVEVCPAQPMQDKDSRLDIPAGCQDLDGPTALAYVRMRKADPRGDLGRMERQREVIGQIVKRAIHPMTVVNPKRWWDLNMGTASSLARTSDTGIPTMFGAGVGLISGFTGAGISMTVPVSNPAAQTSAGSSVLWDEEASQSVFAAIAAGDTGELEKYHK